jgi:hypothetical protein
MLHEEPSKLVCHCPNPWFSHQAFMFSAEILKVNDDVVKVMTQYKKIVEGKTEENGLDTLYDPKPRAEIQGPRKWCCNMVVVSCLGKIHLFILFITKLYLFCLSHWLRFVMGTETITCALGCNSSRNNLIDQSSPLAQYLLTLLNYNLKYDLRHFGNKMI